MLIYTTILNVLFHYFPKCFLFVLYKLFFNKNDFVFNKIIFSPDIKLPFNITSRAVDIFFQSISHGNLEPRTIM